MKRLLYLIPFTGLFFPLPAQQESKAETMLRATQSWKSNCMPKGCILSVDILRGNSGHTPDPNDLRQYISIAVAVDRLTKNPSFIMFEVDPRANKDDGISLTFAHTVPDGKSWKLVFDEEGPLDLSITRCDETTCNAVVPGGVCKGPGDRGFDVLARMQTDQHLLVTYTRGKQVFRTAVSLGLFKEAYQKMLDTELAAPLGKPSR